MEWAIAEHEGVEAERSVGEGRVGHSFGDDRELRFLHDEGADCGKRG